MGRTIRADVAGVGALLDEERGSALVEAALVLPLMVLMLLGLLQLTLLHQARISTEYAAYCAARTGIVWNGDLARMRRAARFALLPTMPRGAAEPEAGRPLAVDSPAALAAAQAALSAAEEGSALASDAARRVRVEVLSPSRDELEKLHGGSLPEEAPFDGVGETPEERSAGELTVRVTYLYELRVPAVSQLFALGRGGEKLGDRYYQKLESTRSMRLQSDLFTRNLP